MLVPVFAGSPAAVEHMTEGAQLIHWHYQILFLFATMPVTGRAGYGVAGLLWRGKILQGQPTVKPNAIVICRMAFQTTPPSIGIFQEGFEAVRMA